MERSFDGRSLASCVGLSPAGLSWIVTDSDVVGIVGLILVDEDANERENTRMEILSCPTSSVCCQPSRLRSVFVDDPA